MSSAQQAVASRPHGDDDDLESVIASHRWLVLVLVQITTLTFGMAVTATNVVLPQVRGALSITHDQAAWIVTVFLVAAAVATPLTGWLAGHLGWRRFMVTTLIGFTLSSLVCGAAGSLEVLLVARAAQGLFGAPLMPLGQGMLLATFPRHMHPLVLMLWGIGAVMGPVLGPILGGLIAESLNWRWAFLMMVPFGLVGTLLALVALGDQERGTSGRLGIIGFFALAICMSSAQLMMDRGHRLDWFDSFEIIVETTLIIAGLSVFIIHTAFSRTPFLNPRMFRNWNFNVGILMALIMGALSFTTIVLFPSLLQDLRGYPDATVGYLVSARGVGNLLSFAIVVPFTRYNARLALAVGMLLQVWAAWQMTLLDINMTDFDVFWTNLVQGFGFGLAYTPMAALAFSTLPTYLVVQGSAVFNLMRNFGSSLFISMSILVLVRSTAENYAGLSAMVSPMNEALRNGGVVGGWTWQSMKGLAELSAEIERQASIGGYLNAFVLFTFAAAAGLPLAWLFRNPNRKKSAR
ncbi:MAG: DHA2 family efflux MFS transporter permease subunit, partial [Burkholderiales bacterium]